MTEDLFPKETCEMIVALSKKQNRLILRRLADAPIKDKDVTPEMEKALKEIGMLMMTSHKGLLIGFSENHMPVFKDSKYSLSDLGKKVIQQLIDIWKVPQTVSSEERSKTK